MAKKGDRAPPPQHSLACKVACCAGAHQARLHGLSMLCRVLTESRQQSAVSRQDTGLAESAGVRRWLG